MADPPSAVQTAPPSLRAARSSARPAEEAEPAEEAPRLPRKRVRQGVMTVVTPVCWGSVDTLVKLLDEMGGLKGTELDDLFGAVRSLHFLRWAVIEEPGGDARGPACEPLLVFSTNYDGARRAHVDELVERLEPTLDDVYRHCRDYPGAGRLREYLLDHHRRHAAFFNGALYRTRARIEAEGQLFRRIQEILGDGRALVGEDVRTVVQGALRRGPRPPAVEDLLEGPFPRPLLHAVARRFGEPPIIWTLGAALVVSVALLAAVVLVLFGWPTTGWGVLLGAVLVVLGLGGLAFLTWVLALRYLARVEKREKEALERKLDPGAGACGVAEVPVDVLEMAEDHQLQNQLTLLNRVRPGRFRWLLLRTSLLAVNTFSRLWFRPLEHLGGLRTIHFAHWILLPERRQLLFISNYDGPWSPYLDMFTQNDTIRGLNAIWTNTVGYPDTRRLIDGGPKDLDKRSWFKDWARRHQVRTQVWYSAYPHLSVSRINLHTRVHEGLFGRPDPERTREWLREL